MTKQELIQELQDCDLSPDVEVICLTSDIHDTPHEVWWNSVDGPIYIDSQKWAKAQWQTRELTGAAVRRTK